MQARDIILIVIATIGITAVMQDRTSQTEIRSWIPTMFPPLPRPPAATEIPAWV